MKLIMGVPCQTRRTTGSDMAWEGRQPPPQLLSLILPISCSVRPQTSAKQSPGNDPPFIIVNFYLKYD